VLVVALLAAAVLAWPLLIAAVAVPLILYPKGLRLAVTLRQPSCVLDAYVQLAEETYGNLGYLQGLWMHRHLVPGPAADARPPRAAAPAGSPASEQPVSSVWE
jgi:hypothetical protein